MIKHDLRPILPMPIKATPYRHQIEAFNFACRLFGLLRGGDVHAPSDLYSVLEKGIPEA